jgi:hemerythrin-like domain-containing protein
MEATQMSPCGGPLPELEIPMINSIVRCLGSEHRKLDDHILQLALAATRLASEPDSIGASRRANEVWNEIRRDLWSHLQIEDELVFSWAESDHAISATLLDTLKVERQAMRDLIAALPVLAEGQEPELQTVEERATFARTLLTLAQTLDSHVERYDGEVLPLILRELFHRSGHGTK